MRQSIEYPANAFVLGGLAVAIEIEAQFSEIERQLHIRIAHLREIAFGSIEIVDEGSEYRAESGVIELFRVRIRRHRDAHDWKVEHRSARSGFETMLVERLRQMLDCN